MAIAFEKIERLLTNKPDDAIIGGIMLEYFVLRSKMENPEGQSWYFKSGAERNREKLESLKNEYEVIRKFFNEHPLDYFIQTLAEADRKKKFESDPLFKKFPLFFKYLFHSKNEYEICLLKEIIELKSKVSQIESIDHYYDSPEEYLKIISW